MRLLVGDLVVLAIAVGGFLWSRRPEIAAIDPSSRPAFERLTSILIPPLMGGIADRCGASESFVILGAFMLLLCVPLALIARRAAHSAAKQKAEPTLAD